MRWIAGGEEPVDPQTGDLLGNAQCLDPLRVLRRNRRRFLTLRHAASIGRDRVSSWSMSTEERILRDFRRIAVVGISDDPARPSYRVASFMMERGYTILPVNPRLRDWRGIAAHADLRSVPPPVEVVNIFRRSEAAGAVVDEAIRIGAKAVWMQEGVVDEEAAGRAREAGILVVMDRCILKEHARLVGRGA